jgi:hypothetical protein
MILINNLLNSERMNAFGPLHGRGSAGFQHGSFLCSPILTKEKAEENLCSIQPAGVYYSAEISRHHAGELNE